MNAVVKMRSNLFIFILPKLPGDRSHNPSCSKEPHIAMKEFCSHVLLQAVYLLASTLAT